MCTTIFNAGIRILSSLLPFFGLDDCFLDAGYNFFVQLQGKKRFTLFPPNAEMQEYSCVHPHMGHSQMNLSNAAPTDVPVSKVRATFYVHESYVQIRLCIKRIFGLMRVSRPDITLNLGSYR